MYLYITILLVCIQATYSKIDACFHENFKDGNNSAFLDSCPEFADNALQFGTYGSAKINQPTFSTSEFFMRTGDLNEQCVIANIPYSIEEGSELFFSYRATGDAVLFVELIDFHTLLSEDLFFLDLVYDQWSMASVTITKNGQFTFQIIAITPEESTLIIDSITCVESSADLNSCINKQEVEKDNQKPENITVDRESNNQEEINQIQLNNDETKEEIDPNSDNDSLDESNQSDYMLENIRLDESNQMYNVLLNILMLEEINNSNEASEDLHSSEDDKDAAGDIKEENIFENEINKNETIKWEEILEYTYDSIKDDIDTLEEEKVNLNYEDDSGSIKEVIEDLQKTFDDKINNIGVEAINFSTEENKEIQFNSIKEEEEETVRNLNNDDLLESSKPFNERMPVGAERGIISSVIGIVLSIAFFLVVGIVLLITRRRAKKVNNYPYYHYEIPNVTKKYNIESVPLYPSA